MKSLLNIAIKAAKAAGKLLLHSANEPVKVNTSIDKDIKLQADLDSEKIILDILSKETDISILSEEYGLKQNNSSDVMQWIVDPLDGSLNFSRSIHLNCVSIGLWNGTEPILGVIFDFNNNQLFSGIVGEGAWLNGQAIRTSEIGFKKDAIILTGFPVYSNFETKALRNFIKDIQNYKKIRLIGSAALSLSMVSKGSVEVYSENNIAIWDVAAGIAIVMAAGGECKFSSGSGENLLDVYAHNGCLK
jgi:myo-inositol-1(or 4)-monophosphatase